MIHIDSGYHIRWVTLSIALVMNAKGDVYRVDAERGTCSCPPGVFRPKAGCKHLKGIRALREALSWPPLTSKMILLKNRYLRWWVNFMNRLSPKENRALNWLESFCNTRITRFKRSRKYLVPRGANFTPQELMYLAALMAIRNGLRIVLHKGGNHARKNRPNKKEGAEVYRGA